MRGLGTYVYLKDVHIFVYVSYPCGQFIPGLQLKIQVVSLLHNLPKGYIILWKILREEFSRIFIKSQGC